PCVADHATLDAALYRLERQDRRPASSQTSREASSDVRLADVRPGAQDHDPQAASSALTMRETASSGQSACTVRRSRAGPTATVGGLIACAKMPRPRSSAIALKARSLEPNTTGTMGPWPPGNAGKPLPR